MDRQTHDDSIYCVSIESRGNNTITCTSKPKHTTMQETLKTKITFGALQNVSPINGMGLYL